MTLIKFISVTSTLAIVSACGISEKQLSDFGKTADQTVQIAGMASTVSDTLINQNEVTRNACIYLQGKKGYALASEPKTKLSPLLSDQKAVFSALSEYADAIAGALDAEEQAKIEEAGGAVATSAGGLLAQTGAAPAVAPTVSLFLTAAVEIEKNRRISAVKAEMRKVLPRLRDLKKLLEADSKQALVEMDQQIQEWEMQTRCVLQASYKKANAEAAFREADQAKRTLLANRKQAEQAVSAMSALVDAHFEILFSDGSFDDGLDILNKFLASLQTIKDA